MYTNKKVKFMYKIILKIKKILIWSLVYLKNWMILRKLKSENINKKCRKTSFFGVLEIFGNGIFLKIVFFC